MRALLTLTILIYSCTGFSQAPPATDIYLAEIDVTSETPALSSVKNLTERSGYDNQPHFIAQDRLLYTSIREDGQADIYRLDTSTGKSERLTFTQESEYSPTPMTNKREFSVVRVEHDGTQRLWAFPLKGGPPRILLSEVKPVGYHTWLDSRRVALFILGEGDGAPHRLFLADINRAKADPVLSQIGRGMKKIPGKAAVAVVHKPKDTQWYIKEIDLKTREASIIVPALKGSEDFDWTGDGSLIMAQESMLYRFRPGKDQNWVKIADLGGSGLKQITRVSVRPNGKAVAIVSTR